MSDATAQGGEQRGPPAFANKIMAGILRSPLHGLLSGMMMLVTFAGRKSGKQFTTPVSQIRLGGRLLFFSSGARWVRNLRGGAPFTVRIKGRDQRAAAEIVDDPEAVLRVTKEYLAKEGVGKAYMLGLSLDKGRQPTDAELREKLKGRVVVYVNV